jgi:hypothetical protein
MLPGSFQLPAALLLILGGVIACFFGYRLFRLVLAIFGFILGAFAATSAFGGGPLWTLAAVVGGGLVGAGLLMAVYFVGVALVGAGLGAVVADLVFSARGEEPTALMVVLFAIAGAVTASYLERYVVILGTAFGGAWALMVAVLAIAGERGAQTATATGRLWSYPFDPMAGGPFVLVWIVLSLAGAGVQLGWTAGKNGRVARRKRKQGQ